MLPRERVMELLRYNRRAGVFHWKKARGPIWAGRKAGSGGHKERIGVDGIYYKASHLAWLIVYGYWPEHEIDHIRGYSNRIKNLREATHAENSRNRQYLRTASGIKGVVRSGNRWCARVFVNRMAVHISNHHSKEAARRAYNVAAHKHHGEFACPS